MGTKSFEMLKLNHISISQIIIIIVLNIETVENAKTKRKKVYFYI